MLRDSSENTTSPEDFVASGNTPSPAPKDAQQKRPGKPIRNFQDLRTMSMTKNERTSAAIPHQGIRILNRSVRFSLPRGNDVKKKKPSGNRVFTEKQSWNRVSN
jgi:hypothetical protein